MDKFFSPAPQFLQLFLAVYLTVLCSNWWCQDLKPRWCVFKPLSREPWGQRWEQLPRVKSTLCALERELYTSLAVKWAFYMLQFPVLIVWLRVNADNQKELQVYYLSHYWEVSLRYEEEISETANLRGPGRLDFVLLSSYRLQKLCILRSLGSRSQGKVTFMNSRCHETFVKMINEEATKLSFERSLQLITWTWFNKFFHFNSIRKISYHKERHVALCY